MTFLKRNIKIIIATAILTAGLIAMLAPTHTIFNQPPSLEGLKKHPERFRIEHYVDNEALSRAFNAVFPPGTPRNEIELALLQAASYQNSSYLAATPENLKFHAGVEPSRHWNAYNYFIDYRTESPDPVTLRIIYSGKTHALLEFYVNRYAFDAPPLFFSNYFNQKNPLENP